MKYLLYHRRRRRRCRLHRSKFKTNHKCILHSVRWIRKGHMILWYNCAFHPCCRRRFRRRRCPHPSCMRCSTNNVTIDVKYTYAHTLTKFQIAIEYSNHFMSIRRLLLCTLSKICYSKTKDKHHNGYFLLSLCNCGSHTHMPNKSVCMAYGTRCVWYLFIHRNTVHIIRSWNICEDVALSGPRPPTTTVLYCTVLCCNPLWVLWMVLYFFVVHEKDAHTASGHMVLETRARLQPNASL